MKLISKNYEDCLARVRSLSENAIARPWGRRLRCVPVGQYKHDAPRTMAINVLPLPALEEARAPAPAPFYRVADLRGHFARFLLEAPGEFGVADVERWLAARGILDIPFQVKCLVREACEAGRIEYRGYDGRRKVYRLAPEPSSETMQTAVNGELAALLEPK